MLNIDFGHVVSQATLTITDVTGKTIQTKYLTSGNMISMDVSGLVPGMYFLSINTGSMVSTNKFLKE